MMDGFPWWPLIGGFAVLLLKCGYNRRSLRWVGCNFWWGAWWLLAALGGNNGLGRFEFAFYFFIFLYFFIIMVEKSRFVLELCTFNFVLDFTFTFIYFFFFKLGFSVYFKISIIGLRCRFTLLFDEKECCVFTLWRRSKEGGVGWKRN